MTKRHASEQTKIIVIGALLGLIVVLAAALLALAIAGPPGAEVLLDGVARILDALSR